VSLPESFRDLFEEDQAIATAAAPPNGEDEVRVEAEKLPAPPQEHAPEIAALLVRLQNLPSLPYIVEVARRRDAATPAGQVPPPWAEEEKNAEQAALEDFLRAWEPFFSSPPPDWSRYPDSIRLFRFHLAQLFGAPVGIEAGEILVWEFFPEFYRTLRHLGVLRLPPGIDSSGPFAQIDLAGLFESFCQMFPCGAAGVEFPSEFPENGILPPPPEAEDLRQGLRADRALFLRTADYFQNLPPNTPARIALLRYFDHPAWAAGFLEQSGRVATAKELALMWRRDAEQIFLREQKTFLTGAAWGQWLREESGSGFSPAWRPGLRGLQNFEETRLHYRVLQALWDARRRVQTGGRRAAEDLPDPAQPGAFLQVEGTETGTRITSAYRAPDSTGETFIEVAQPSETGESP